MKIHQIFINLRKFEYVLKISLYISMEEEEDLQSLGRNEYENDLIPQTPDNMPLIETKPVFTKDPLPKGLLFEGSENFVHFLPYFGFYDEAFCEIVLPKNYNKSLSIIEKQKSINIENLTKCYQELSEIKKRNIVPVKSKLSVLNRKYWQETVILYWKESKYLEILQKKRIKAYKQNIKLFNNLIDIIHELQINSRYIAILYSRIEAVTKTMTEFESRLQSRIKAVGLALSEKKQYMGYLPHPFLNYESAKARLISIIRASGRKMDPSIHYLCESGETGFFEDFMKSSFSPLGAIESKYTEKEIDLRIESTIKAISLFTELKNRDDIEIIGLISSRFWFARTLICRIDLFKINETFNKKFFKLKQEMVKNLKPPKSNLSIFSSDLKPCEFLKSFSMLLPSIDIFGSCYFMYSPEDIASTFHLLHLRFAGFLANELKVDIEKKIILNGIKFLWKLVFISSSIPNVDSLIRFVERMKGISCYPKILFDSFQFPLQVMKSLF
ncbi:hypothetical protein TRFO_08279 [Tritrichomonas foetus]|uniref:Uncharacterized protein n=1 Tax=Tritrichomonas foetus TaxID=1144522 RepID=A0A1J4JKJ5_9EUKA|nr:hypothetical protein TRFO_08279 [Tritrichomonas foetus]|eukprot:OHS99656.1 hypothetical protein TRFO_08279 [Tritrichomonas foetus]